MLGHSITPKIKPNLSIKENLFVQGQIVENEIKEDEEDDKKESPQNALDEDQLKDSGDSEKMLQGEGADTPFDNEMSLAIPLVKNLPRLARPAVRYLIGKDFEVYRLDRKDDLYSYVRHLIALTIAKHISDSGVQLIKAGDWRNIPALRKKDNLIELVPEDEDTKKTVSKKLEMEAEVKHFAILLSNGDVITPDAIIGYARKSKQATLAGALREASDHEEWKDRGVLAGEKWSLSDWQGFHENKRNKASTNDKRPGKASGDPKRKRKAE